MGNGFHPFDDDSHPGLAGGIRRQKSRQGIHESGILQPLCKPFGKKDFQVTFRRLYLFHDFWSAVQYGHQVFDIPAQQIIACTPLFEGLDLGCQKVRRRQQTDSGA